LIAQAFARAGAAHVLGVDIVADNIAAAEQLAAGSGLPLEFRCADIAKLEAAPAGPFDIVLLLAVIHKTYEPVRMLQFYSSMARELVVVRLPGGARKGVYSHERRGNETVDVVGTMNGCGFDLARTERGPTREHGLEPVLYFRPRVLRIRGI